jgi:hypothetical protein
LVAARTDLTQHLGANTFAVDASGRQQPRGLD